MLEHKDPRVNLEKKRKTFFLIGMVLSLLFVIAAFNYRSYESNDKYLKTNLHEIDIIQIEIPPTTQPPEVKEELPKPKPLIIKIIDDGDEQTKDINLDVSTSFDESIDIFDYPEMPEDTGYAEDDKIYTNVEIKPEFKGGLAAMYEYLSSTIKYPVMAKETGITGIVYVEFVVEKDGSITDVKALRKVEGGCTEEALRAVNAMPAWESAIQNGRRVRCKFVLPVKFNLR